MRIMPLFDAEASEKQRRAQMQANGASTEGRPEPLIPGANGLTGTVRNGIITIKGPCGFGHSMNFETAIALASWLNQHAQTGLARDAIFRIIEDNSD